MTIEFGFNVKNYKSFNSRGAGFTAIKPINLIIGKNNIGKSSLTDALDALCKSETQNNEIKTSIEYTAVLTPDALATVFAEGTTGGGLPGDHWRHNGRKFSEKTVSWEINEKNRINFTEYPDFATEVQMNYVAKLALNLSQTLSTYQHKKLLADRDIEIEKDGDDIRLSSKGAGATRVIHAYLNHSNLNRSHIQKTLLSALNEIFSPDLVFREIVTRYHNDEGAWEIYLSDQHREIVALSKSGSGLKTILLVLLNLLIRPLFEKIEIKKYIFSFEELENNLHPALQRNLFLYLENFAVKNGCHIFITTHSNIAIDVYSNSPNAQINHIQTKNGESFGALFSDTSDGYSILSDLGIKASDILQSNGIIWVEGPSDRIYINKFISLWSNDKLREGAHYQFVYYGGSILANLDASIPEGSFDDTLKVFRINRNFVFVCDSDKRHPRDKLKPRVSKVKEEIEKENGYCWVSKCKEIENYIPKEAFELVHSKASLPQIGEYELIAEYLKANKISTAKEYLEKHSKACRYVEHFTRDNLAFRPDLEEALKQICNRISRWNHLPELFPSS